MREEVGRQIGLSARKVQVRQTVDASAAAYLTLCFVLFSLLHMPFSSPGIDLVPGELL